MRRRFAAAKETLFRPELGIGYSSYHDGRGQRSAQRGSVRFEEFEKFEDFSDPIEQQLTHGGQLTDFVHRKILMNGRTLLAVLIVVDLLGNFSFIRGDTLVLDPGSPSWGTSQAGHRTARLARDKR